ncbi:MAG: D-glycero-beta-D-manno-heptose 1-phosphate adenylyltransferase [Bacteroidales bacterium]|nr:D-glycero-beta-D-manno-heptose 1-phosphate adenylyltransferase [Bacteroidales bacterium]
MMSHFDNIKSKIVSLQQLQQELARRAGEKVVFTNGCFDIVHHGHVAYLAQARDLGDLLVLGLNSDASVKRLKGPARPINDEQSRALVLAAFEFIDYVVLFEEDTPFDLISALQPDVLVKGGDYKIEDIVGHDIVEKKGGRVVTIDFVPGFSTTKIVEKINQQ